jgi:hypothetical protein
MYWFNQNKMKKLKLNCNWLSIPSFSQDEIDNNLGYRCMWSKHMQGSFELSSSILIAPREVNYSCWKWRSTSFPSFGYHWCGQSKPSRDSQMTRMHAHGCVWVGQNVTGDTKVKTYQSCRSRPSLFYYLTVVFHRKRTIYILAYTCSVISTKNIGDVLT